MKRFALFALVFACDTSKDDEIADLQQQLDDLQDLLEEDDANTGTETSDGSDEHDSVDTDADVDTDEPDVGGTKVLFLTALEYDGDLTGATGIADPHAAGDSICQSAAASAGLSGTFRVWLSTADKDAIDHIAGDGPWVLPRDGEQVFASKAGIPGGPRREIDEDVFGAFLPGSESYVWSATDTFGRHAGPDCAAWSTANRNSFGMAGRTHDQQDWTEDSAFGCDADMRLLCFQR